MLTEQDHIKHSGHQLTTCEKLILFSPFRLVTVLALCIFTAELMGIIFLNSMPTLPVATEILMDGLLLNIILCPALIFLLFRHLKHLIVRYEFNEKRLLCCKVNRPGFFRRLFAFESRRQSWH